MLRICQTSHQRGREGPDRLFWFHSHSVNGGKTVVLVTVPRQESEGQSIQTATGTARACRGAFDEGHDHVHMTTVRGENLV